MLVKEEDLRRYLRKIFENDISNIENLVFESLLLESQLGISHYFDNLKDIAEIVIGIKEDDFLAAKILEVHSNLSEKLGTLNKKQKKNLKRTFYGEINKLLSCGPDNEKEVNIGKIIFKDILKYLPLLTEENIREYFSVHPSHDLSFILGEFELDHRMRENKKFPVYGKFSLPEDLELSLVEFLDKIDKASSKFSKLIRPVMVNKGEGTEWYKLAEDSEWLVVLPLSPESFFEWSLSVVNADGVASPENYKEDTGNPDARLHWCTAKRGHHAPWIGLLKYYRLLCSIAIKKGDAYKPEDKNRKISLKFSYAEKGWVVDDPDALYPVHIHYTRQEDIPNMYYDDSGQPDEYYVTEFDKPMFSYSTETVDAENDAMTMASAKSVLGNILSDCQEALKKLNDNNKLSMLKDKTDPKSKYEDVQGQFFDL